MPMLELSVAAGSLRSSCPDGPIATPAVVMDADGSEVGELLVWVTDGFLSALEFAWWTDERPHALPVPEQLRLHPR